MIWLGIALTIMALWIFYLHWQMQKLTRRVDEETNKLWLYAEGTDRKVNAIKSGGKDGLQSES